MFTIRKARVSDVPQIYDLLRDYGKTGDMLPRSLSEIYDVVRAFFVACPEDDDGTLAGACALQICWEDLGEIRSMAVAPGFRGKGLGARLMEACEADGKLLGLKRMFVLTYIPDYFAKFGFQLIDKSELPHKIWMDCIKCVNFPDCGEIGMMRTL